MRQIILDTETTGLEVQRDHRVVEIGCLELVHRRLTGRHFHRYLNPERAIDAGARAITGITDESLLDKPRFAEIADEFLAFIDGAEIVAHNAAFDIGFLDAEFARAGHGERALSSRVSVLDTLVLAREKFPGQRNSLTALCKRLGVDDSHRELHGAMLDANLLAEVYLILTAGQSQLGFGEEAAAAVATAPGEIRISARPRVLRARDEEVARHAARLQAIEKNSRDGCVWLRVEPVS
ncbi:DNA polymerase III subunit epsilon [Dokdonella sp.]|uniref:DNA polymerase III subunit epsilon n=1 Tax=Dokdonella sp. TaxID=2291710 RepID=UPI0031C2DBAE|nr:DNA polymerase III subunit epsilon [Dokdonella sp.]